MRYCLLIVLMVFSLAACSKQPIEKDPTQHLFANGDKLVVKDQQVTLYNKQGEMLQQGTFTSPTFLEARSFLIDIKQDLKAKHYTDFLQGDIAYPLRVNHKGKATLYKNSEQLQAHFNEVFTPEILQTILQQDPFRLFANDQGVMIASGVVWFNQHGIFVVNQS
jgi:hypothetical protein